MFAALLRIKRNKEALEKLGTYSLFHF